MTKIKTRFAPSPTGHLHVGGARTALFSFLLARKLGGEFLLRIEDTDQDRHQEDAVPKILEDLHWLGLHWDEGIEKGGPNGPYRQSERLELYSRYVQKLLDEGKAYYAFDTADELEAMRAAATAEKRSFHYPRPATLPTADDAEKAKSQGRPVVVRFICQAKDVTIHDDAFGDVTVPAGEMEDFIIRKADGFPTYYLANVVDDATMGITYIMRGQEFLGQTWRQVLLRAALGFAEPGYCHLPLIMDMQGRKLSKRDGDVDVFSFRKAGYLPEALISFIALLGWSPGMDKERMPLDEMIELFSTDGIGKSNAKFDRAKLLAFNTDAVAAATEDRLLETFNDYLSVNETPIPQGDDALLRHLLKINHGFRTFADIITKSGVLFQADDSYSFDQKAVEKVLVKGEKSGYAVLQEIRPLLAAADWTAESLQKLVDDFCAAGGLGMGKVAQPLRVAVTGTTISPTICETLLILGKVRTLARIDRCLNSRDQGPGTRDQDTRV
ncbi:MAG: glutamate--tRNA ligase [Planctomycetaceae bacterium]|nr:MAG: glutamate--tRNA ligase [Planctomycetaceae bacterium]